MNNGLHHSFGRRILFSAFLSTIFVGIFFLTYFVYSSLSLNFFNENYRNFLLNIKKEIKNQITTDLNNNDNANINSILEPYLNNKIDLLIVYRTNQELIQVFTKKGVTKENLRIVDKTYFNHLKETENIYFEENSTFHIANSTNNNETSMLILGAVTPKDINNPNFNYHYVLVFATQDYLLSRKNLESTIVRNSFFGGITILALIAIIFMIKRIISHSRQRKELKAEINAIKDSVKSSSIINKTTSDKNKPDSSLPSETLNDKPIDETEKTAIIHNANKTSPEISDNHNKNDLITNNNNQENSKEENLANQSESNKKDSINISEVEERNRNFLLEFISYFFSPAEKSTYQEIDIDEISHTSTTGKKIIRDFKDIQEEKANLEQNRLYSRRLKTLLGIWLFAKPAGSIDLQSSTKNISNTSNTDNSNELMQKSLSVIGAPLISNTSKEKNTNQQNSISPSLYTVSHIGPIADYALPDLVCYFKTELNPREITGRPILTLVHPAEIPTSESYLSSITTIPWIGTEKKFFKIGEPYIEKKDRAIAINVVQMINNKPHIIKLIYTLEKYDRLVSEQKNHLLYLINVLFKLFKSFPEYHSFIFSTKYSLENKVSYFFKTIFQYDQTIQKLFNEENPLFKLHYSLWSFSQGTLKNTKSNFIKLMKELPQILNEQFKHQEVVFFSDYHNRIVSIGFDDPPLPDYSQSNTLNTTKISDSDNTLNTPSNDSVTVTLSQKIKHVIEQNLIDSVGMESIGVEWGEKPLSAPTSKQKAEIIDFEN